MLIGESLFFRKKEFNISLFDIDEANFLISDFIVILHSLLSRITILLILLNSLCDLNSNTGKAIRFER
jgi:thymidine kinase